MYRQCTTEKTAAQQKIFLDALYYAMQDQLYSEISITDLCKQTGLSRNIFYRLFDCKDDILYALIDNCFYECSQEIVTGEPREKLLSFFIFWKNQKVLLDVLKKNRLESLLSVRGTICCCHIDLGIHNLLGVSKKIDDISTISFYVSGFIGLLFHWYTSDFLKSPEEMADITLQIFSLHQK